jgi:hypothetical protein
MEELAQVYLTKQQVLKKYKFLSENMLKNLLHKDLDNFREKVVHKIGRRLIFDEIALLTYFKNSR